MATVWKCPLHIKSLTVGDPKGTRRSSAVINAKYNGQALVGGFDVEGNPDPAGLSFCDKNRPDLNRCD